MTKPTAQELWERIEERINTLHGIALHHGTIFPGDTTLSMVQLYAQTFHEEQIEKNTIMIGEPYKKVATETTYFLSKNPND